MNLKSYLFSNFVLTLVSLGTFVVILFNTNPHQADVVTLGAFFASLYFLIFGILVFIGFYARVRRSNYEVIFSFLVPAARQAALISFIVIGLLLLKTIKIFSWWDASLFIITMILFEFYFQTRKA